jgi:hypothetical protein
MIAMQLAQLDDDEEMNEDTLYEACESFMRRHGKPLSQSEVRLLTQHVKCLAQR